MKPINIVLAGTSNARARGAVLVGAAHLSPPPPKPKPLTVAHKQQTSVVLLGDASATLTSKLSPDKFWQENLKKETENNVLKSHTTAHTTPPPPSSPRTLREAKLRVLLRRTNGSVHCTVRIPGGVQRIAAAINV